MSGQFTQSSNSYIQYNLPVVFPCITFTDAEQSHVNQSANTTHFHNCIELGLCKSGSGTVIMEKETFSYSAGDYTFIPENIAHKIQAFSDTEDCWEYVCFDPYLLFHNLLPDILLDKLLLDLRNNYGILSDATNQDLHFLLNCIFSELHKKEPYYQDSLKGLLFSLVTLLARSNKSKDLSKSDYQWLYSTLDYIRRNYNKKISIAELAKECCSLSESRFRKKFTDIMHVSPLDYINHLRIRMACQFIYRNERPINEIASDVGFPTLSSFNRNFHAFMGCSPSVWLKKQAFDKN